jgi:hypothetical protein
MMYGPQPTLEGAEASEAVTSAANFVTSCSICFLKNFFARSASFTISYSLAFAEIRLEFPDSYFRFEDIMSWFTVQQIKINKQYGDEIEKYRRENVFCI